MSRRHAAKALLATAVTSAVTVGGFGLLSQPSAAGAQASPSDCYTLIVVPICGSSSAAPTGTPSPTTSTSAPAGPSSSATSTATPSSDASPSSTASTTATSAATGQSSTASKPKTVVNVRLSGLRIAQHGNTLVVRFTVTNTGTIPVGGYLITARATGYQTRAWLSNLPVGQPIRVSTTWPIRRHRALVKVVVQGDPRHQVKESDESDNTLSGSTRVR